MFLPFGTLVNKIIGCSSKLLLMEEIPNNHLGCIKPCKQTDTLPTSTGDRRISEPSTVSLSIGAPQVGSTYQRFNVNTADLMHLFLLRGPQLQEETVKL